MMQVQEAVAWSVGEKTGEGSRPSDFSAGQADLFLCEMFGDPDPPPVRGLAGDAHAVSAAPPQLVQGAGPGSELLDRVSDHHVRRKACA